MRLIVETESVGKKWTARCYEEGAGDEDLIGVSSEPKNSEPAAASSAVGDFFRRRREEES